MHGLDEIWRGIWKNVIIFLLKERKAPEKVH